MEIPPIHEQSRRSHYKPGKTVLILEKDLTNWFKSKQIHAVKIGKPRHRVKVHSGR